MRIFLIGMFCALCFILASLGLYIFAPDAIADSYCSKHTTFITRGEFERYEDFTSRLDDFIDSHTIVSLDYERRYYGTDSVMIYYIECQ